MAVNDPHKLSTKLCKLFDAGYSDVRTFARLCEEPWQLIERITTDPGFRISRECQTRVGKVLSRFMAAHPDLYHDAGPIIPETRRGVFEESSPRFDERIFTLRKGNGRFLMSVRFPADDVDDATIEWLWRVLAKKDPEAQLKVI